MLPMRRLFLLLFATAACAVVLAPGVASAHNSLESSDPTDGSTLIATPTVVRLTFAKDVPLDTLSVTLSLPDGTRTDLQGASHGASAREVLVPLPALGAGWHSARWRLVGSDGHVVTSRIRFLTPAAAPATVPPGGTATTVPAPVAPPDDTEPQSAFPDWLRWLLRYGSYLAMMAFAGVVTTSLLEARGGPGGVAARIASVALAAVAAMAVLQLAALASDLTGSGFAGSFGHIGRAAETAPGMALALRVPLALAGWALVVSSNRPRQHSADTALLVSLAMLGTWSFAGHSFSLRWPWYGVLVDVAHHAAAAAWVGGLALLTLRLRSTSHTAPDIELLGRFSRMAGWAVGVLVATGVAQSLRLVGGAGGAWQATHTRLLAAKVVVLAAMLLLARRNRRALGRLDPDAADGGGLAAVRRSVAQELLLGVAVFALTSSLVVSPPATSAGNAQAPAPTIEHRSHTT
jgi:copper transport protein